MPLYSFRCPVGHVTEALCRLDLSDAPRTCPTIVPRSDSCTGCKPCNCGETEPCGDRLERVLAAPASTFPGAGRWRGEL